MPVKLTLKRPDGTTAEALSIYDSDTLRQMSVGETISLLEGMRDFAYYARSQFFSPIDALECERKEIEKNKKEAGYELLASAIIFAVCAAIELLLLATEHTFLALIMGFFAVGTPFIFVGVLLIKFLPAKHKYNKRIPQIESSLSQLKEKENNELYYTHVDQMVTGSVVLPDYVFQVEALDYMISTLQNHRADSLGAAVNLYETAKALNKQSIILSSQLAAQERAAEYAAQAASAAQRAANNAEVTATNSLYSRKY